MLPLLKIRSPSASKDATHRKRPETPRSARPTCCQTLHDPAQIDCIEDVCSAYGFHDVAARPVFDQQTFLCENRQRLTYGRPRHSQPFGKWCLGNTLTAESFPCRIISVCELAPWFVDSHLDNDASLLDQPTLHGIPMRGPQRIFPVPQCKRPPGPQHCIRPRDLGSKIDPGRGGLQHVRSMLRLDGCSAELHR